MGEDGVEQFVATPELQSEDAIGGDPLPPGQVWAISPGGAGREPRALPHRGQRRPGLRRQDPQPARAGAVPRERPSAPSRTCSRRAQELVGDRDPRQHEFTVQLRAFDAAKSGAGLGVPVLLALGSALLEKSLRGGLIVVGGLNLGGGIDPVHNAVAVAELAVEKGAATLLMPVSARRQLNDLSDDMATKVNILYYGDAREALVKAIGD